MRHSANETRKQVKKLTDRLLKLEDNQKERQKLEKLKQQIEETMRLED
jgi:hypothetical protein